MSKPITLNLTLRHTEMVMALLRGERRRRAKALERSTFVPAPGAYHSDAMRVKVMDELYLQLYDQYEAIINQQKGLPK